MLSPALREQVRLDLSAADALTAAELQPFTQEAMLRIANMQNEYNRRNAFDLSNTY